MALRVDYKALEQGRAEELRKELQTQLESKVIDSGGSIDNLRGSILGLVVSENYETAMSELDRYVQQKHEYPNFAQRTHRYVAHSQDLIMAIKAKRNFPGLSGLTLSQQQELLETVQIHFDELKEYLRKIELIDREVRLDDARSTIYTIKTTIYTVFAIFMVALILDLIHGGTARSLNVVIDDLIQKGMDWLY